MSKQLGDKAFTTENKALAINLDRSIYGTFAEIGAGQEVARNFFVAGGAAGTIAKSMSAYDMKVSDDIYGKSSRYVSKDRLETMLTHEFDQNISRLKEQRGSETRFFSFADTVAAKSFSGNNECHGWMGLRFQHAAGSSISQVIIHVKMKDRSNVQQQQAIGIIGVNLMFACFNFADNKEKFVDVLLENLGKDRVEINMIDIEGEAFGGVDKRIFGLLLVEKSVCKAMMFNSNGDVVELKDELYSKNILLCRGSYRPPTKLNIDMLNSGEEAFICDLKKNDDFNPDKDKILILPEISMNKLLERGEVDNNDFLARVNLLSNLGLSVLISNFKNYGQLSAYISSKTKKKLAFVFGFHNMKEIFDEENYLDQVGGLLGGLGGLLGHRTSLYCYPAKSDNNEKILFFEDCDIDKKLDYLFKYLNDIHRLKNVKNFNKDVFHIWSRQVLKEIQNGDSSWEQTVSEEIIKIIKDECLFGVPCNV